MCEPATPQTYTLRTVVAIVGAGGSPAGGATGGTGDSAASPPPPSGPNPQAAWRNLMQPMPLGRKIRLTVRNTSIKIRTRQQCCGHPGEPGC